MRLGFHYHTPAIKKDGKIFMPGYLGLFVDSIAAECDTLVCFQHTPTESEKHLLGYEVKSDNVQLINIGPHSAIPKRTLKGYINRNIFKEWESKLDAMLVRASTPLLPVIASVFKKPLALLLVSDATIGLDNLPQPGWRKQLIKLWANWYQNQEDKIAKRALTFVNSKLLYDKLDGKIPNLILTRTTTLSKNDFYHREDTCKDSTIKLFFAGRLSRTKGLIEIAEVMGELSQQGYQLKWDLVGMLDEKDPILSDLEKIQETYNMPGSIKFHGFKTAGPELLEYYRNADVFISASQASSEGFPRTIWEAMASSTPVITTTVGSVPMYINDEAMLIPPKDKVALKEALEKVITDSSLRKDLIKKGIELSKNNTLEKRAAELMDQFKAWLKDNHALETQVKAEEAL